MKKRVFILLAMLPTMLVGLQAQETKNHNLEVAKNLEIFNALYRNLDLMYVDTIDANKVVTAGIDAMLGSLDRYTEYYPEDRQKDLKTMLTGKYAGIGALIRYHQKLKRVVIDEPYEGMPATKVGLKKGDIILQIDDSVTTDKNTNYVSSHLRGDAGTTFTLKVLRPSTGKTMNFKITRQSIKMPEITWYGMLDNGIGYIYLNTFTGEPSKPMRLAYLDLIKQGAKSLVLDLRGNGGGSLSECVDILSMWLPKGEKIVETRGKLKRANSEYKTRLEPIDTVMPMVVLVNQETASASEIVSGSLQDLDRAVVIGTRTYGKGLVQSSRELPYNGSLKLTTSKYYIPSGRCIQAIDYKLKRDGKTSKVPDSLTNVFHTIGGREVRDGGGIKPDIEIKHDTMANVVFYLSNDDVLLDWGTKYAQKHAEIAPIEEFEITDADFEELKEMARESGFKYDRLSENRLKDLRKVAEFEGYYEDAKEEFEALEKKLEHNLDREFERFKKDIKELMAQEIVKRYYYQSGALQEALKADEDLTKAIEVLGSEEYDKILKK